MPLNASEIKEYRSGVAAQDRESALKYIAKLHPRVTVTIILAIIHDGLGATTNTPEKQATLNFLQVADEILSEVHKKQNASRWKLLSHIGELTKERITTELENLVQKAALMTVTGDALALWKESEIWLEGWYRHTFDDPNIKKDKSGKPIKDKNGITSSVDGEDTAFQLKTGMCKLQVAEYYGKAAEILRGKIEAYNQQVLNAQLHPVVVAPLLVEPVPVAPLVVPSSSASIASVLVSQPKPPTILPDLVVVAPAPALVPAPKEQIEVSQKEGMTSITVNISSLDNVMIQRVLDAVKQATAPQAVIVPLPKLVVPEIEEKEPASDRYLPAFLNEYADANDAVKIQMLEYAVTDKDLGMTDNQKRMLEKLKDEIIANLDNYMNAPYLIPLTKVPLPMFFSRTHVALANEKKLDVYKLTDPADLLKVLFDMRTTLIGACSDGLLGKVNTLLLDSFTMLRKVPQPARHASHGLVVKNA